MRHLDRKMIRKIGIRHYLNYFKSNLKISFLESIEFKSSLYSQILLSFIFFLVFLFFGKIFIGIAGDVINWKFQDYVLFIYTMNLFVDLVGFFWYGYMKKLSTQIKEGTLNLILFKPGNPFLNFLLFRGFNPLIFIIFDALFYIPFLIYIGNWEIINIVLGTIMLILVTIFGIIFIQFLISFTWYFIELGNTLVNNLYWESLQVNLSNYPMTFFEKSSLKIGSVESKF